MKATVVLTLYNGENTIGEQLDSLMNQTVKADEVLIFDDSSTDNSFNLVDSYIKKNSLNNWKLYKNKVNLGWRKNFIMGMDCATGEYIFPCDQDDIWEPGKIYEMTRVMDENPDVDLLASTYIEMFEQEDGGKVYKEKVYSSNSLISLYELTPNILNVPFPGCVYCLRKEFYLSVRKYWIETCPHDCLLWRYSVLKNTAYIISKPLIIWRKHKDSSFALELKKRDVASELNWRDCEKKELYKLIEYADEVLKSEDSKKTVMRNLEWVFLREKWLKDRKLRDSIKLLRYLDLYGNFKGWLKDVYLAYFRR